MFDGNASCAICKTVLKKSERNFGVSLTGWTYGFCDGCMDKRKDDITKLLHAKA